MNVLMVHRPGGAFGYITDGIMNAFRDRGHKVQRWDGNENTWNDFKPDLYIGCSSHKQPIPPRRNCKVAVHVNPYGPVDLGGLNENDANKRWTLAQKVNAVFGYGHEDDRLLWSYWTKNHGIPWVPMPTAGDKTIFKTLPNVQKKYDIVYLGGRWSYKGITIDSYLLPVLRSGTLTYKLHGWGDWPAGISSGVLGEDQACSFLNSGKIGPCISEQHTHAHGIDIPERAFKVALCGTLVVHDCTVALRRMIPSAVIASNPQQFKELCHHFCSNEQERIELVDKQRAEVLAGHTYHHRCANLLSVLGFEAESKHMLEN